MVGIIELHLLAASLCCMAPLGQALAVLEQRRGRFDAAGKLFAKAAEINPRHAPTYTAWALMEWRQGRYGLAKALFMRGEEDCEPHAPLLSAHAK